MTATAHHHEPRRSGTASERFELRIPAESKQMISAAARVLGVDASRFARDTLVERAQEVLASRETTTLVPASYFDDLLAALDADVEPTEALTRSLARARTHIESDHLGR